jgi:DNA-binding NarL/FixJ family response regulator
LFTEREQEVLNLLATGLNNDEMAKELKLSIHTIKVYVRNIIMKLNAKNRTEAAVIATQRNLIQKAS